MATVVLVGLIYMICEMYIDDCSVFGDTNIEFVSRLRLVFGLFRKHNLYIKANQCYFGFKELEFVGKVLYEEGLKISRTKIQSVLDFAANDIADAMSRLCRNNMVDSPQEYTEEHILSAISASTKSNASQIAKIGRMHNSKVGHFGLERALKRFKDRNDVWQFQRQHIRHFIDECACCQKMRMLKIPIHAHGFTTSTYTPMECLNIDFIGPLSDLN